MNLELRGYTIFIIYEETLTDTYFIKVTSVNTKKWPLFSNKIWGLMEY